MKRLSSRDKLAARPISGVATPSRPAAPARQPRRPPKARNASHTTGRAGRGPGSGHAAALRSIRPCWLAQGARCGRHRSRRRLRHRQDSNRPMEGRMSPASFKICSMGLRHRHRRPAGLSIQPRLPARNTATKLVRPVHRLGAGLAVDPLHCLRVLCWAVLCQRHDGRSRVRLALSLGIIVIALFMAGLPIGGRSIAKPSRRSESSPRLLDCVLCSRISASWGISLGTGRKLRRSSRKRQPALP